MSPRPRQGARAHAFATLLTGTIDRCLRSQYEDCIIYLLQIEHPVPDFDGWKKAFDDDPLGRERSGVTRYRVYRPVGDPGLVAVDLEFSTLEDAETFVPRLREMWQGVEGTIMSKPRLRIVEVVESGEP